MDISVFQSDKGDCLLLTSSDKRRILIDGGMRASYTRFVAPSLGEDDLDLVCVSHIDQDHISGVLQMLDDMVAWRIHEFHLENGNPSHPQPKSPRPPGVKQIWHNAFHTQVGDNAGRIEDLLAASSAILSGTEDQELLRIAVEQRSIATSIPEAIQLSQRIDDKQLGIPLNRSFRNRLALVHSSKRPIRLGSLALFVLAPFAEDLEKLRKEWNKWLEKNRPRLEQLQRRARADAERLGASDLQTLLNIQLAQARELGDRKKVTTPNLASLMLLVEEDGKRLLLTGDGHADDILKGLAHYGKLERHGGVHVDALKVQHHGSEHNMTPAFARAVTADHYIFCANGEHENPDLAVIRTILDSRLGTPGQLSRNPQVGNRFRLWFNSSQDATEKREAKRHMAKVEKLVEERAQASGGRMTYHFQKENDASFGLRI